MTTRIIPTTRSELDEALHVHSIFPSIGQCCDCHHPEIIYTLSVAVALIKPRMLIFVILVRKRLRLANGRSNAKSQLRT